MNRIFGFALIILTIQCSSRDHDEMNRLLEIAQNLYENGIISEEIRVELRTSVALGEINNYTTLFSSMHGLAFSELPDRTKEQLTGDFYYATPMPTQNTEISKKYVKVISVLREKNLLEKKSLDAIKITFSEPSDDIEALIIMEALDYFFIKQISDNLK